MYGFTITVNGITSVKEGDICYNNIVCSNHMIHKFEQDKVFADTKDYIVLLDGVILNRLVLMEQYHAINDGSQWLNTIIQLYREKGEVFFIELRGSFSGAIYDKAADKWVVFGDHIGSKFTFFAKVGDFFCVAEEMGLVYRMMKANGINYHLSSESSYLLLTFGFMIEDKTLCEEVKKIQPGYYIVYENGTVIEKQYYLLDNTYDETISEQDAIEIVDLNFRKAVDREFSKDTEYGYKHIAALSGGLDSRMTSFVAHDLGYSKQLNFTFSQTDYWDESIPKRIANDLKHEWIFKFLNNGLWLYDIDGITEQTGGNVIYYGSAHGNSFYRLFNFDKFGMVHSGQISGAMNGSNVKSFDDSFKQFDFCKAMYSTKYYDRIKHILTAQINQELGWYYYRCLNGTCYGTQQVYNYSESYSPFLDIEFLEHILHIPITYRINYNLYKKWIISKYPQAAEYEWERFGKKITASTIHVFGREMTYGDIPRRLIAYVAKKAGLKNDSGNLKNMNPINYYLVHNEDLRKHLESYFQYLDAIRDEDLQNTIRETQTTGDPMEIIQAVSLLAAIKLFYI